MEMILDFLKKQECTEVELDADNPYAVKLYEKFGFRKYDIKYRLDL
jgi:ribosomal protein S18 acetylase RimI-like enzyme